MAMQEGPVVSRDDAREAIFGSNVLGGIGNGVMPMIHILMDTVQALTLCLEN